MSELIFQSKLSEEEIERNFKDVDFFSCLMEGLEEALAYEKGTAEADVLVRKRSLDEIEPTARRT